MTTPRIYLPTSPVAWRSVAVAIIGTLGLVVGSYAIGSSFGGGGTPASGSGIPIRDLPGIVGSERAVLTTAPLVPAPITRTHATKVVVELETVEKTLSVGEVTRAMTMHHWSVAQLRRNLQQIGTPQSAERSQ